MMMQLFIMISDISNGVRPTYIATRWSECILEENYKQGDEEKKLGIPNSKLTDRSQASAKNKALGQVAFLRGLVKPLLEVVQKLFNVFTPCMKNIESMSV
jgi:hypothetical protein